MHQWPLLLFTLALQIAAGGFLALVILSIHSAKIVWQECAILTLCAIFGTICSLAHLGDMLGAYRALANIESSWLSREVWLVSIFTLSSLLTTYQAYKQQVRPIFLILTAIFGLLAVLASSAVYATTSMPNWSLFEQYPYLTFLTSTCLLGPTLVCLQRRSFPKALVILLVLGLLLCMQSASYIPPSALNSVRFILVGLGVSLSFLAVYKDHAIVLSSASLCLLVGEGLGRYIFFLD